MTLLETIVAFVLLAVVGVACLDLSRGATALSTTSAAWTQAVAEADAAMELAAVDAPREEPRREPRREPRGTTRASDDTRAVAVARLPWRGNPDVDQIDVVVTLRSGAHYRLSRLVPARAAALSVR